MAPTQIKKKPLAPKGYTKYKRTLVRDNHGNYHISFNVENRQHKLLVGLQAALCIGLYVFLFWAWLVLTPDTVCR